MKYKTQDPKFYIEVPLNMDGQLSGNPVLVGQSGIVPDDEPLFILRGRDLAALPTLHDYKANAYDAGATDEHLSAINKRIEVFRQFFEQKEDRLKIPDTSIADLHDGKPA